MSTMKYPKVVSRDVLNKFTLANNGLFYIEEKYDGSHFRFGIDKEGNRWFGSKEVTYSDVRLPDKMFVKAVEKANQALDILEKTEKIDNYYIFFSEYIKSPKHNTLTYDREPRNNLVLFDIVKDGIFLEPNNVRHMASKMDIEPVSLREILDRFPTFDEAKSLINTSSLGGTNMEGVVIKNYDIMLEINGQIRPLIYKIVRDDFKELNDKEWNKHSKDNDVINKIASALNKEAIFRKAVQHLNDSGQATGEMKDMVKLIPLVYKDLYEEYQPIIEDILFKHFQKDIEKTIIHGLPEYYKQILYNKVESTFNQ